jgi:hypothetical protein
MDIRQIAPQLQHLIGRPLRSVRYHCLAHEASAAELSGPGFYLGGEVEVNVQDGQAVFIAADQSDVWCTDYTVGVSRSSLFLPKVLEAFDASNLPLWQPHISQPVIGVAVLGWDKECHVVRFAFPAGVVLVGCSRMGERFGGGDDIAARSHDEAVNGMRGMESIEEQWSAGIA